MSERIRCDLCGALGWCEHCAPEHPVRYVACFGCRRTFAVPAKAPKALYWCEACVKAAQPKPR